MVTFQHIEYLFALCLIPVFVLLFIIYIKWKKARINKIGDPKLVQHLISDYNPQKFFLKFILIVTAFTLVVIALANPRRPIGSSNIRRNGIDVMIALDVSKSMLAQDIKPNRLERAKQLVSKLIDKLPGDRIGIVVFAGRAYLQMPLTSDHAAAKMYLSTASPDIVPTQGTVIGDALKMCFAGFNTKEKKYKAIVLISDGEDHDETAEKLAQSLANEGVMINTVGIGSAEGSTIEDAVTGELKKDAEGKLVITKLNESELKILAAKTGGIYQLFTNTDEVASAVDGQLRTMGQRSITETALVNYQNYFPWLLAAALLLLMIEFFMSEKKSVPVQKSKKVKVVKLKPAAFTGLLLMSFVVPVALFAQNNKDLIKKGNEAYNKSQFQTAAENYKQAVEKDPFDTTAEYNLGNAQYKSNKPDDALQAYDAAIAGSRGPIDKSGAWYNKGVVLQNNKKLNECIDAYKNALRLNPADEDARLNLQKALLQKKQQEQKENQDKQKKQDKKQQQQQNPKEQQPKPQPSKMTRKEAEEKLKALLQQEKNLQDKLRKVDAASPNKPEKDW